MLPGPMRLLLRAAALLGLAVPALAIAQTGAEGFDSMIRGASLRAEVGTGIYGDELSGNLGATALGARALEGDRYLFLWDAQAELVEGVVAFEHPFYDLYGGQLHVRGEGELRLLPSGEFSPLAGIAIGINGSALTRAGAPFDGGAQFNSLDGLGGVVGSLQLAGGAGASWLTPNRSLVVSANVVAELDSSEANQPSLALLGGGPRIRLDWRDDLVVIAEAAYVVTTSRLNAALQETTQVNRWWLNATGVKMLGTHLFAGLGIRVSRQGSSVAYTNGLTYNTGLPVDSRIWVMGGYAW
jgi:hypothetical protein